MRKFYCFAVILAITALKIFSGGITLSPINKTYIYDSFTDGLSPFASSLVYFAIDNRTKLELIEEYEFFNGLQGDVLKVKIKGGAYSGFVGYILEESVSIDKESVRAGAYVIIKKEDVRDERKYRITGSYVEEGMEFLRLVDESDGFEFSISDKNDICFIIDKTAEIKRMLRKGYKLIKCYDLDSLNPISSVCVCGEYFSDNDGFIYYKSDSIALILQKAGYAKSYVKADSDIAAVFMRKLNRVEIKENIRDYNIGGCEFQIFCQNNPTGKSGLYINPLSFENLSILNYPDMLDDADEKVVGGFYIENLTSGVEIFYINRAQNAKLFYFDPANFKRNKLNIDEHIDCGYNISRDGYYLLISENSPEKKWRVEIPKTLYSGYVKSADASFICKFAPDSELSLPKNRYEFISYSAETPYDLIHEKFELKDRDLSLNIKQKTVKQKSDFFSSAFWGKWKKFAFKKDNLAIAATAGALENLGDMTITGPNSVIFNNGKYTIEGNIEFVDENSVNINITNVSSKILHKDKQFMVNPSLYSSNLVIPARYSFLAGVIRLSYEGIYFTRKNYYEGDTIDDALVLETNHNFRSLFSKDIDTARYKIYFSQE
ncbi:MAG TPA: hypothetical protein PK385_09570 [Spirochaetota bacterium]|nr:hypothetical protein [Spirochaetota bacterium]HOS33570.1 hypothetical protein [Spirochaetota bacterium]HOS56294.1 hypothetical protein [Spirochaetota bacterium]HPK62474.1 hypothetical protein [Spirochaetota bacterium]HQF78750.1 hypothetical protein [Spirochaetota bacterium]